MARVSVPFTVGFNDDGFANWLVAQKKRQRTVRDTLFYAKKFASVLDTGDASVILTQVKPLSQKHVLSALANLSKYQGRYERWNQIRRNYSLHWVKSDSITHFARFFSEELTLEAMIKRIRQMIEKLPPLMGKIIRFACLIGLRASEVIESVRLLNRQSLDIYHLVIDVPYYNPERQALEHFRFPDIFIRQTKKAYISFITKEQLSAIGILDCKTPIPTTIPSRVAITKACQRRHIPMDLHLCRKIFASWLRKEGVQPEIVDLLQGRVSQSILTRHYLAPAQSMKDDILKALEKLQQQL